MADLSDPFTGLDRIPLVDIIHDVPWCRGVAFRYTEYPQRGTPIESAKARLLDGTTPVNGELMICGSCGREAFYGDLRPVGCTW